MDRRERRDTLQFDDHLPVHPQVEEVAVDQRAFAVDERHSLVGLDVEVPVLQFVSEALRIYRFEQSWTGLAVDRDSCVDDRAGEVIEAERIRQHGHRKKQGR
jgi:hypothetical protein